MKTVQIRNGNGTRTVVADDDTCKLLLSDSDLQIIRENSQYCDHARELLGTILSAVDELTRTQQKQQMKIYAAQYRLQQSHTNGETHNIERLEKELANIKKEKVHTNITIRILNQEREKAAEAHRVFVSTLENNQ